MTKIEYRYLNTKNIKVTLKFTQPIHLAHEVVESLEYQSTDKVNLNIPCPCIGCIKGGFDISTDIESTVIKQRQHLYIKRTCQGWQENQYSSKSDCSCKLECDIAISNSQL
ncbi:hypothetical protein [Vibrio harveyi]|uniref:hypothetical protein n=1 Tax=Vibrio harveyi TaxID=669 RepID=UPI0012D80415|nr:hypothetical protein [Vibrio harveyi]